MRHQVVAAFVKYVLSLLMWVRIALVRAAETNCLIQLEDIVGDGLVEVRRLVGGVDPHLVLTVVVKVESTVNSREVHSVEVLLDALPCLPAHEVVPSEFTLFRKFDCPLAADFEDYPLVCPGDIRVAVLGA